MLRVQWVGLVYAAAAGLGCNQVFGIGRNTQEQPSPVTAQDASATDSSGTATDAASTQQRVHGPELVASLYVPASASSSLLTAAISAASTSPDGSVGSAGPHGSSTPSADGGPTHSGPVQSSAVDGGFDSAAADVGLDGAVTDAGLDSATAEAGDACALSDSGYMCTGCPAAYSWNGTQCVPRSCTSSEVDCGLGGDDLCCASYAVPGGTFRRGPNNIYDVRVASFALDKYEVTVGRFRKFVDAYGAGWRPQAGDGAHPLILETGWLAEWDRLLPGDQVGLLDSLHCDNEMETWRLPNASRRLPLNCVNWYQAFAFCVWDGARLPTGAEQEYAASGGAEERDFPWGSELPDPDRAAYGCGDIDNPCDSHTIQPVGSKPLGVGRYGQLDLAGSLWEWSWDYFSAEEGDCDNCANTFWDGTRRIGGGGYGTHVSVLGAESLALGYPSLGEPGTGFRCARPFALGTVYVAPEASAP